MPLARNEYDTVVIGAGVAGLAAGRVLAAAGQRSRTNEGSDEPDFMRAQRARGATSSAAGLAALER